jgi:hypothetical protein
MYYPYIQYPLGGTLHTDNTYPKESLALTRDFRIFREQTIYLEIRASDGGFQGFLFIREKPFPPSDPKCAGKKPRACFYRVPPVKEPRRRERFIFGC